MILTRQNVLPYLVQAGLLGLDRIVGGPLKVVPHQCRNRTFRVIDGRGPGLFVKQSRPEEGDWHVGSTLETEAQCYALAAGSSRLEAVLAPFRAFDRQHQILVLGLIEPAESLAEHHHRTGEFSVPAAVAAGQALATCHIELGKALRFGEASIDLPSQVPWILRPDRLDPHASAAQSAAQARVVAIVQRHPEIDERLKALAAGWRVNGIIHGDMKWANCLLDPIGPGDAAPAVRIVDWEMAGTGNVAWDAAGILQSYLASWIRAAQLRKGDQPAELATTAAPLAPMQHAVQAFWRAYIDRLDVGGKAAAGLFGLTVQYAAARLVQTAFEAMDGDARISGHMVLALQLASNMLTAPETAAATLLGVSP